jgi:phage terminase large subunit GpA-like protein
MVYSRGLCESHYKKANLSGELKAGDVEQLDFEIGKVITPKWMLDKITIPGVCRKRLTDRALAIIAERPPSTCSDWIEKNVILKKTSNGEERIDFKLFPEMRYIFDLYHTASVQRVHLCFSSQRGKTVYNMGMVAYLVKEKCLSGMYNLPSENLITYFPETRLIPMFNASGVEVEKHDKKGRIIYFKNGCHLRFGLLTKPKTLAESSEDFVFDDEIDEIENWTIDPIELSDNRLTTAKRPFHVVTSTPKLLTDFGIYGRRKNSKRFELAIQCDCGLAFVPKFPETFVWDKSKAWDVLQVEKSAYIECPDCKARFDDKNHLDKVMNKQVWKCENDEKPMVDIWVRSRRWDGIYRTPSDVVARYEKVKNDPEAYRDFRNSWCADPVDITVKNVDINFDPLKSNQFSRNIYEIPADVFATTAGVDVSGGCLWLWLHGWRPENKVSNYYTKMIEIKGDSEEDTREALNELLDIATLNRFNHLGGKEKVFAGGGIDAGYRTEFIYNFCLENPNWIPCRGGSPMGKLWEEKDADPEKKYRNKYRGLTYLLFHTHRMQDIIHSRMCARPGVPGSIEFAIDEGERVFKHLKAQVRRDVQIRGRTETIWEKRKRDSDDHLRDAAANAELIGRLQGFELVSKIVETDKKEQRKEPAQQSYHGPSSGYSGRM